MKKLLTLLTCLILSACCDDKPATARPECIPDAPEVAGIYSKPLGSVNVGGETCQLFETYEKYNCSNHTVVRDYQSGCGYNCNWKVLTRVTKCPSQTTVNEVHQERCGKACSREVVQ